MSSFSTAVLAITVLGILTVVFCICSIIHDRKKQRLARRERRRRNLSESTARTLLSYKSLQESEAYVYRRRA